MRSQINLIRAAADPRSRRSLGEQHGGSASSRTERSSPSVKPLLDHGELNLPTVATTAAHPIVDLCMRSRAYLIAATDIACGPVSDRAFGAGNGIWAGCV